MKIAFLTTFYPPKWIGGTEIASKNIVENLKKENDVEVITCEDKGKLKILKYLISSIKKLKKEKYEVIHCQSTFPAIAPYLLGKEYIIYCRGSDVYFPNWWQKIINRIVLKKARKILVLTKDMQEKVKKEYKLDSQIISNGINLEKFEKISREKSRKGFGLKKELIILYVGTLKKIKGVKYLIEAFNEIKDKNIFLWIIGDGEEKENLKKISKNKNMIFLGKKENKEIPNFMKSADIFVLPSLSEGFPNSILEAMASGLPIISTKTKGIPEIVKKENGILVPIRNSQEIKYSLIELLKSPKKREYFSNNNLKEIKNYSWEKVCNQLERVYSTLK